MLGYQNFVETNRHCAIEDTIRMTAQLIIAVIISLTGLVSVTNGQFGSKHSNHGMRGKTIFEKNMTS
jgi:hypothetical protein